METKNQGTAFGGDQQCRQAGETVTWPGNPPDALLMPVCPSFPSGLLMPSKMPPCWLALLLLIVAASFALGPLTCHTFTAPAACAGGGAMDLSPTR